MRTLRLQYPLRVLCRVLEVSRSGYYAWHTTPLDARPPVAENVLAQTFVATRPNETWVTDMTYVPTVEGWLYLAGVKDLYTREVVGHAMDARMTTDLVQSALLKAIDTKRPTGGSSITPIAALNIVPRRIKPP